MKYIFCFFCSDHDTQKESELSTYEKLLQSVQETILKGEFRTQDKPAKRNILRIGEDFWDFFFFYCKINYQVEINTGFA